MDKIAKRIIAIGIAVLLVMGIYGSYIKYQNEKLKEENEKIVKEIDELQKLSIKKFQRAKSNQSKVKAKTAEQKKTEIWLKPTDNSNWKPWMDYRMITDTSSPQWKYINESCYVDSKGFLRHKDSYCVALGSWFGKIGTKYIVTLSSGREIEVVKSEEKDNADTDEDNYLAYDGHIIEFLIEADHPWLVKQGVIRSGTMGTLNVFKGRIIKIEKVIEG